MKDLLEEDIDGIVGPVSHLGGCRAAVTAALFGAAFLLASGLLFAGGLPKPDHVVIVIEENKSFSQIIAKSVMFKTSAPYINRLANEGALFTSSYAVAHPSEPNYLALFSGSTQGVPDDRCPVSFSGSNLASELLKRKMTFAIYSESMPSAGFKGCFAEGNLYARKHNPVADWPELPAGMSQPFSAFPSDFTKLPTVSFVIPNQIDDMHDGRTAEEAIARGDAWLKANIDRYIRWAKSNNSLFVLTWDEDDDSSSNHIVTLFLGPMVRPGPYGERIDHYRVLRTILDIYGLPALGAASSARPITEPWVKTE